MELIQRKPIKETKHIAYKANNGVVKYFNSVINNFNREFAEYMNLKENEPIQSGKIVDVIIKG